MAISGVAPLAGITATAAIDALDLSHGDVLLMAGATGGVGSLAVQLATCAEAQIITPALPDDEPFLREGHPDGVDALLDLVNYTPVPIAAATWNIHEARSRFRVI